jgi:hypothetical protein
MMSAFTFGTHLFPPPIKSANANIYATSIAFLVVACFQFPSEKEFKKCKVCTLSEKASRINHAENL